MDLVLVLLQQLSYLGAGLFVLPQLAHRNGYRQSLFIPLAYFLGLTLQVVVIYFFLAVGLSWQELPRVLAALGLILLPHGLRREFRVFKASRPAARLSPGYLLFFLAVLLVPISLLTLLTLGLPLSSFDGVAVWAVKAKYLYFGENLTTDAFINPDRVHPHPGYPLFLPILLYQQMASVQEPSELAMRFGYWILLLTGVYLLFQLYRGWAGRWVAVAAMGVLLYTPVFSFRLEQGSPSTLYADFPLALFMSFGIAFLFRFLVGRDHLDLTGSMIFLSSGVLLKLEGAVWAFFLYLFALPALIDKQVSSKKEVALLLIPPLLYVLFRLAHHSLPPSSDVQFPSIQQVTALLTEIPALIVFWINSLTEFSFWGITPWVALLGILFGIASNTRHLPALLALAVPAQLTFVLLTLGLLGIQLGLFDYYARAAYPRWLIQIIPAALTAAVALNSDRLKR